MHLSFSSRRVRRRSRLSGSSPVSQDRASGFDLTTGNSELDFVLQAANGVYPLEVKSATNTKAKSLGVYMRGYAPALAFKSSLKNYSESRDVKSIPLYALGIALPPMLA